MALEEPSPSGSTVMAFHSSSNLAGGKDADCATAKASHFGALSLESLMRNQWALMRASKKKQRLVWKLVDLWKDNLEMNFE
jgi:hypothetical protein